MSLDFSLNLDPQFKFLLHLDIISFPYFGNQPQFTYNTLSLLFLLYGLYRLSTLFDSLLLILLFQTLFGIRFQKLFSSFRLKL
jgi:hypothetical protein